MLDPAIALLEQQILGEAAMPNDVAPEEGGEEIVSEFMKAIMSTQPLLEEATIEEKLEAIKFILY